MEQSLTLQKKKQNKIKEKRKLKEIRYGYTILKDLDTQYIFQIVGDITIDLNYLLRQDSSNIISSWNDFLKIKEVKKSNQGKFIEIFLDTDVSVRSDLSVLNYFLKRSQQKELYDLANMIEEYQGILNTKQIDESNFCQESQTNDKFMVKQEYISEIEESLQEEWTFQKSNEKAEKVINELKDSMNDSDDYYFYVLFKGCKQDQIKCRIGQSIQNFRDFLCLSDEQIDHLCSRKPIIFNFKYQHQFKEYLFNRISSQIRFLKQNKSDLDIFRQGINFLLTQTLDIYSIDNLSVRVNLDQYVYILSNYQNQMDDVLWVGKCQPIRNQSISRVLKGKRDLMTYLKEQQQKTQQNPIQYNQIYYDSKYQEQTKLFYDKFYSLNYNNICPTIQDSI